MLIFELLFSYIYGIRHQSASETMFCLILSGSLACHIPDMYIFFLLFFGEYLVGGKSSFRYCSDDYKASCDGSSG